MSDAQHEIPEDAEAVDEMQVDALAISEDRRRMFARKTDRMSVLGDLLDSLFASLRGAGESWQKLELDDRVERARDRALIAVLDRIAAEANADDPTTV